MLQKSIAGLSCWFFRMMLKTAKKLPLLPEWDSFWLVTFFKYNSIFSYFSHQILYMRHVMLSIFSLRIPRNRIVVIILVALGLTFGSCSKRQLPTTTPVLISDPEMLAFLNSGTQYKLNTRRTKPNQVIRTAEKFIGTPHCMGGTTSKCMDCSGLT